MLTQQLGSYRWWAALTGQPATAGSATSLPQSCHPRRADRTVTSMATLWPRGPLHTVSSLALHKPLRVLSTAAAPAAACDRGGQPQGDPSLTALVFLPRPEVQYLGVGAGANVLRFGRVQNADGVAAALA